MRHRTKIVRRIWRLSVKMIENATSLFLAVSVGVLSVGVMALAF